MKDYLTKPFSFDRFMQGIHKTSLFNNENVSGIARTTDDSFYVKSDKRLIKILYADIIYIEANRNYLSLIIENHPKIIIHATLGNMENTLSNCSFMIRVHRSLLINKNKIIQILGNEILFNDNIAVPIGALYKEEFFKSIKVL